MVPGNVVSAVDGLGCVLSCVVGLRASRVASGDKEGVALARLESFRERAAS